MSTSRDQQPVEPRELMRQLTAGQIGRRAFIARAAALGFSASAIAAFLAACGGNATNTPAPAATTAAPGATTAAPAATTAATSAAGAASPTRPSSPAATTGSPSAAGSPTRAGSPSASPAAAGGGGVGTVSKGPFGASGGLGPGPTKRGGGGALKILYWQAPTILNIHLASGTKDVDASRLVYEPLADFAPDDTMVPWLAAEIPSRENGGVAADGKSVTWKLKKGVVWSDGQPFTAKDCIFTWQYAADPETGAGTVDAYELVDKMEAVDDTTVKITFKEPNPAWYRPLTDAIIPEHVFKDGKGANAKNFAGNLKPVGTGPYKVDNFAPGDAITYSINPTWRDPNGPAFDTVQWKGGGDAPSAARSVFQTGDYNVAWNLQVAPAVLNPIVQASGGKAALGFQPGQGSEVVYFNHSDPNKEEDGERSIAKNKHPFLSDLNVRKALQFVADRKTMAETGYGQSGEPAVAVTNAPASAIPTDQLPWEFSLDKANAALDAAGWAKSGQYRAKGGAQMKVVYQTTVNAVRQQEQQILKDALEKVGIQVELKSVDAGVFFSSDPGNPDTAAHFYADLEMYTNSAGSPDLQTFLANFTTKQIPTKANKWGLGNSSRYSNPDYDKLNDQSARELDPVKRNDLFKAQFKKLYDDAVALPLVGRKLAYGAMTGIEGFQGGPWTGLTWNIANWTKK